MRWVKTCKIALRNIRIARGEFALPQALTHPFLRRKSLGVERKLVSERKGGRPAERKNARAQICTFSLNDELFLHICSPMEQKNRSEREDTQIFKLQTHPYFILH